MTQVELKEACKFLSNLPMIIGGLDGKATLKELEEIDEYLLLISIGDCDYNLLQKMKNRTQHLVEKYGVSHLLALGLWKHFDEDINEPESLQKFDYSEDLLEYLTDCASKCIMSTSQHNQMIQQISDEVTFDIEALKKMLSADEKQQFDSLFAQVQAESDHAKQRQLFKELNALQKHFCQKYLGDSSKVQGFPALCMWNYGKQKTCDFAGFFLFLIHHTLAF